MSDKIGKAVAQDIRAVVPPHTELHIDPFCKCNHIAIM